MSQPRVLFFGDDVVCGTHDPDGRGLAGRLASSAHAAGTPIAAFDLGIPGDTSVAVSRRWRKEAAPRLAVGAPWAAVFCFGAADVATEPGIPEADSAQALQKVIVRAESADRPPLIVGPPPLGDTRQRERTLRLSARLERVAGIYGADFVETAVTLAGMPAWAATDPLGPAEHELLAGLVAGRFLRWLAHTPVPA